jgi:hypothetical protein
MSEQFSESDILFATIAFQMQQTRIAMKNDRL